VCDGCRALRTSSYSHDRENEERTLELFRENRIIIVEEVAGRLNVSVGSSCSLIHDSRKFSKVWARLMPKELTEERKRKRLDVCSRHLARYREEGDNFLQQIVTGDETWIHHYEPEINRQSVHWKHPSPPVAKKFRTQPSAGKLILTVFWDSQGPILETHHERETTVISATYCDMLQRELKRGERTVKGNFVVTRQRPPPHCSPHFGNSQTTDVEGYGTHSLQSGFSAI